MLQRLAYGNGDSVEYEYDSKGRVTKQTYEDGEYVLYTYGNDGTLATVYDSATGITATYGYNYMGQLYRYEERSPGYSYVLQYFYNGKEQVKSVRESVNGHDRYGEITYDDDDRVASFTKVHATREYTYDKLDRVSSTKTINKGTTEVFNTTYTFGANSSQVSALRHAGTGYDVTYSYTYDGNGNILSVSGGTNTTTYEYDSANQLLRENNQAGGYTHVWTYDNAGNILSRTEYAYTTGALGTPTDTVTYTYGNSAWGDLLTGYDGNTITSDQLGNTLSDGTWNYTWEHGRELASMTDGETTWRYNYNANGMRNYRSDGSTYYSYAYNGSELDCMYIRRGDDETRVNFTHAPDGTPMGFVVGTTTYYYVTNLQGDVVALLSPSGNKVVEYTYDAWGNILSITGSLANSIGTLNPLRYRGYVYDNETGLYYLQSRYYDPQLGRFISADGLVSTGQGFVGNNMFAYCGNNPGTRCDMEGTRYCEATSVSKESAYNRSYSCYWQRQVTLEKYNPNPIGEYSGGKVYLITDTDKMYAQFPGDVIVRDARGSNDDNNLTIQYSSQIKNRDIQREIISLLKKYELENPTGWYRTEDSMMLEWDVHNKGAWLSQFVPFQNKLLEKSIHVAFDNKSEGWSIWDHCVDALKKLIFH